MATPLACLPISTWPAWSCPSSRSNRQLIASVLIQPEGGEQFCHAVFPVKPTLMRKHRQF
jgi:hypothetical protein